MYVVNDDLVMRDDDYSLFSLEEMEVYQFNEAGFKAILVFAEHEISEYDEWAKYAQTIDGIDLSESREFWDALLESKIVVEK